MPQAVTAVLRLAAAPFATRQAFLWLITLYVVLQAGLRIAVSPSLGRDDLIEAIFAQGWALGYSPTQPPLYTWLIVAVSAVVGDGIVAHALVKFTCLWAAYVCYFLAAERVLGSAYLAALATSCWLLTYMFGYDATQNSTQSILLLALASALLLQVLRMRDGAGWPGYLALGLLLGLGTLSKYGFPLCAVTLALAGLLDAPLRRALLDWRMIPAIVLALVIVAPHALWLKFGPYNFRGAFTGALQVGWKQDYWTGVAAGLLSLVRSSFDFLAPGLVLWVLLFARAFAPLRAPAGEGRPMRLVLDCWLVLSYAVVIAGVLFSGATDIKYHYMVVVLLPAPIWLFLRVQALALPAWRGQAFALATVLAMVAVTVAVAWRGFTDPRCGRCYLSWDYHGVAERLRQAGFTHGTILAEDHHVGGNLPSWFPDSVLYTLKFEDFVPPRHSAGDGQCLAIWDTASEGNDLPDELEDFLKIRLGVDTDAAPPAAVIDLPYRHSSKRHLRLAYVLFPQGSGRCR